MAGSENPTDEIQAIQVNPADDVSIVEPSSAKSMVETLVADQIVLATLSQAILAKIQPRLSEHIFGQNTYEENVAAPIGQLANNLTGVSLDQTAQRNNKGKFSDTVDLTQSQNDDHTPPDQGELDGTFASAVESKAILLVGDTCAQLSAKRREQVLSKLNPYLTSLGKEDFPEAEKELFGQGLVKIDLKDAYLTVPVWRDHQKYLRFLWRDSLLEFACLPFGLASAPRDKIKKVLQNCQQLLNNPVTSVRELSKFLGLLSSSIQAVFPAPLHYRYLQQAKNSVLKRQKSYEALVNLDSEALQEVQWWKNNLVAWNGKALLQQSTDLTIETDASLQGWGAHCQGVSTGGGGRYRRAVST
ncbi:uncharacterized protein LOC114542492 [Dendronephthya gigantea]|uniref:uncharacterized protein LOC114542492 n=1 Tax=Dendronephthya gigantea TaxID=151771 RepID=UPI0010699AF3|nr:uncharacterized protein LOC114542492 [Dendronephthya gigantea]